MNKLYKQNRFIKKAMLKHSNIYTYENVDYIKSNKKVLITCKIHGDFLQTPEKHLQNRGCRKCGYLRVSEKQSDDTKSFKKKCFTLYGDMYDYSLVVYKNSITKVRIKCNKHGIFLKKPNDHLQGQGCPNCSNEKKRLVSKDLDKYFKKLRTLVSSVYLKGGYTKRSLAYEVLGCDWKSFKKHLESNDYGFKVGDDKLDLDHIIPLSSGSNKKELLKLSHYTNFQLLPSYFNRYIKKTKEFSKIDLINYLGVKL